jgi:REP element-mobilizing transposase RayT
MLRGTDRSQLFFDDDDRHAFIERLSRYREACGFSLLAYAIMGNHVHLLIKEGIDQGISEIIKRLATSYAHYLNLRYDRTGYVFENRYASEAVMSDAQLLATCRYILLNPSKAGLRPYEWTSYRDYIDNGAQSDSLTDTSLILSQFSHNPNKARAAFQEFLCQEQGLNEDFLEDARSRRLSDKQALDIIKKVAQIDSGDVLAAFDKEKRDRILDTLKKSGLSIRQISRLTGINRGIVCKARTRG